MSDETVKEVQPVEPIKLSIDVITNHIGMLVMKVLSLEEKLEQAKKDIGVVEIEKLAMKQEMDMLNIKIQSLSVPTEPVAPEPPEPKRLKVVKSKHKSE
jgi:hypothetical protein